MRDIKYLALVFDGWFPSPIESNVAFKCASDAANADDHFTLSTDGYVFKFFGGPIDGRYE